MYPLQYRPLIEAALREDLGGAGDVTTEAVISVSTVTAARLVARQGGTIAGLEMALEAFRILDPAVEATTLVADGERVDAGAVLATLSGRARAILTAERTALNLLGRMSGIATATAVVVGSIEGTGAVVAETRKTTPGLRALEKYAVEMGGGSNHRYSLGETVMVKDNHAAVAGGVLQAVKLVRAAVGHTIKIVAEVDTLVQLEELLTDPVDIVLLDNMTPEELRTAVRMVDGRMITEASGGITSDTARLIAQTGVDVLSMGSLTNSVTSLDVALDIDPIT